MLYRSFVRVLHSYVWMSLLFVLVACTPSSTPGATAVTPILPSSTPADQQLTATPQTINQAPPTVTLHLTTRPTAATLHLATATTAPAILTPTTIPATPALTATTTASSSSVMGTISACNASDFTHTAEGEGVAGNTLFWIVYTNTSSHPCIIRGFPTVEAFDARGKFVTASLLEWCRHCFFASAPTPTPDYYYNLPSPTPGMFEHVVQAGGQFAIFFQWQKQLRTEIVTIRLHLPGNTGHIDLKLAFPLTNPHPVSEPVFYRLSP
jgi:hypothetical protein